MTRTSALFFRRALGQIAAGKVQYICDSRIPTEIWLIRFQKELATASSFCCFDAHFACMKKLHAKSPCCSADAVRFGKRRKQYAEYKKTWRIRKKQRGRDWIRGSVPLLLRFLNHAIGSSEARAKSKEKTARTLQWIALESWYMMDTVAFLILKRHNWLIQRCHS